MEARLVALGRPRARRQAVVCGDLNVAHTQHDIKNWKGNRGKAGFLEDERAYLTRWFDEHGYVDLGRRFGGVGRGVERYIAPKRPARCAGRPAIDPGRLDREPESAVVGSVTLHDSLPAFVRAGHGSRGEGRGGEGKRMLGHGATMSTRPNLLYPAADGNSRPRC